LGAQLPQQVSVLLRMPDDARRCARTVLLDPAVLTAVMYMGPSTFIMQLPVCTEELMASPPP
jgi:hypothetical protein